MRRRGIGRPEAPHRSQLRPTLTSLTTWRAPPLTPPTPLWRNCRNSHVGPLDVVTIFIHNSNDSRKSLNFGKFQF